LTAGHEQEKQAVRDGKEAEAVKHLKDSIDIYASQPENEASLNNAALDYFSLFKITGDSAALEHGTAMVEKALAMSPGDSILLGNAATAILEGAMRTIIGDAVDLQTLKMGGRIEWLPYLYEEQSAQAPYIDRVRTNSGVAKALDYYQRVLILAPKDADTYAVLASIYEFTRDVQALRSLLERIEQSDPDLSDQIRQTHEYYAGKRDETMGKDVDSAIARLEATLTAVTDKGGATFAIATTSLVGQMINASILGQDVDVDRVVDLAERAYAAAPSEPTNNTLVGALCLRAGRTLAAQQPAYAEMAAKAERSVGHGYLLATILSREGELRDAAIANPDIQRVTTLSLESLAKFPNGCGPFDWVVLRANKPEQAEKLADIFGGNEVAQLALKINQRLAPASGAHALRLYFASQMMGDDAAAEEVLRRAGEDGVPIAIEVK
jgi:tetratricopeptide (TPR) repeat protein